MQTLDNEVMSCLQISSKMKGFANETKLLAYVRNMHGRVVIYKKTKTFLIDDQLLFHRLHLHRYK